MMKRPAGAVSTNAEPFSDKLPFANRKLEIWYYAAKNDPQGGANHSPTKTLTGWTDENGCLQVKFAEAGIDVSKGDTVIVKAPGFTGQTDVIQGVTPFVSGYQGWSGLRSDFFEDTVEFETLSGFDLTGVDIPNSEISFETQKRIYYEGPVTVFATNKLTNATETATFNVNRYDLEYRPKKTGLQLTTIDTTYNVKPNYELRWQIKDSGYVFGTSEPTGAGGWETSTASWCAVSLWISRFRLRIMKEIRLACSTMCRCTLSPSTKTAAGLIQVPQTCMRHSEKCPPISSRGRTPSAM
jgi:hypothetical protein